MKKLIEFYKGRIAVYRYMIDGVIPKDNLESVIKHERTREKINCYEQFVSELEKIEKANEPCKRLGATTCIHFANNDTGCFNCHEHYTQIGVKDVII